MRIRSEGRICNMAGVDAGMSRMLEEDAELSSEVIEEEKRHFQKIAKAFLYYKYKWAGLLHVLYVIPV